jgi:hypothetical protein
MDLVSFVECSNQKRSLSALFQLLVDCATEQGFSEVADGALTTTSRFICRSIGLPQWR